MKQTTEKAFESYVAQVLLAKGWQTGNVTGKIKVPGADAIREAL